MSNATTYFPFIQLARSLARLYTPTHACLSVCRSLFLYARLSVLLTTFCYSYVSIFVALLSYTIFYFLHSVSFIQIARIHHTRPSYLPVCLSICFFLYLTSSYHYYPYFSIAFVFSFCTFSFTSIFAHFLLLSPRFSSSSSPSTSASHSLLPSHVPSTLQHQFSSPPLLSLLHSPLLSIYSPCSSSSPQHSLSRHSSPLPPSLPRFNTRITKSDTNLT